MQFVTTNDNIASYATFEWFAHDFKCHVLIAVMKSRHIREYLKTAHTKKIVATQRIFRKCTIHIEELMQKSIYTIIGAKTKHTKWVQMNTNIKKNNEREIAYMRKCNKQIRNIIERTTEKKIRTKR